MTVAGKSIILVDYTISTKEDGKVVDTTIESDAKAAGVYSEEASYKPRIIVIGSGEVPPGFEEALASMSEGEERTFEIPPEKAFGTRDPSKVRVIPAREFSVRGIIPRPGLEVELRGERGVVISVGSGRVIVDFNHALAGKTILFKARLLKTYAGPEEKIKALFLKWFSNVEEASIGVSISDGEVVLELPAQLMSQRDFTYNLSGFTEYVDKYLEEVNRLKIVATIYERKREESGQAGQ